MTLETDRSLFDGPDDEGVAKDGRLTKQIERVYTFMLNPEWYTLDEISQATEAPQPSVAARLRDLRKPRFGGHTVDREHIATTNQYVYRLFPSEHGLLDGTGARSPKAEARKRIEAFLDAFDANHMPSWPIITTHGETLWAQDLREMLR